MTKDIIIQYLEKHGPSFSSDITEYLLDHESISKVAARQRVSRASSKYAIEKLPGWKFPNNVDFLYINGQEKRPDFWEKLLKAFTKKKTAYGRVLNALKARGNAIPRPYFDVISGSPINNLKGHPKSSLILNNLLNIGFLKEVSSIDKSYIGFSDVVPFGYFDLSLLKNKLLVEDALLEHLKEWLKKTGLVSYNKVTTRCSENHTNFGSFSWDLIGPSYLKPLTSFKGTKPSPGFVVADIFIEAELTLEQVSYFIYKCDVLSQMKKTRPFIPLLVSCNEFTKPALLLGKKKGLLFVTLDNLFGFKIAEILKELLNTLKHATSVATKNPEKISELLKTLGQSNIDLNNLKGSLFNMLVGHLVFKGEGGNIDIGKLVTYFPNEGESPPVQREIDVLRQEGNHSTTVYECKGYKSPIEESLVKEWVEQKIPYIYKALKQQIQFQNQRIAFEFWTSSALMPDAKKYLEEVSKKTTKYKISWKEGKEIIKYSRDKNLSSINNDLKEHFS
jgi:hypothetical protein